MSPTELSPGGETPEAAVVDLRSKLLKSVKWSVLAEIGSRGLQPLATLFLASILTPADFGTVATAMVVISLGQLLQEFGLSKAVVQTETHRELYANNAFWMNVLGGSMLLASVFALASPLSLLLGTPEAAPVLRALSPQLLLLALVGVHVALLQRSGDFRTLFVARFVASLIPVAVSITLAMKGYGVWALVAGTLSGSAAQVLLYWRLSPWRPRLSMDFGALKRMLAFSRWVMLEGLTSWLISWGDVVILGYFLATSDLGKYRLGLLIVILLSNVVFTPIVPISYSLFSRLQADREALRRHYLVITKIVCAVVLPIAAMSAFLAAPFVATVFGPRWSGVEIVIAMMAIRWGVGCIVGLNSTAYTAIGRPDLNVMLLVAAAAIALPVYALAAPFGLVVFCWARLLTAQVDNLFNLIVGMQKLQISGAEIWHNLRGVIGGLAALVLVIVPAIYAGAMLSPLFAVLAALAGLAVYVGTLAVVERPFLATTMRTAVASFT